MSDLGVRPLSARSVALNLLLGARKPHMTGRDLCALGEMFDVSTATMRVALSRMVAAGDLALPGERYELSPRLLERHERYETLINPRRRAHGGAWRMVVVVDRGRPLDRRTALRSAMAGQRFAELREGVWLRPDNLDELPAVDDTGVEVFTTVPADERRLARELWELDAWAAQARELTGLLRTTAIKPIDQLTAAAVAVRLLCTDPVLPDELAPEHWPADELRRAYDDYRTALSAQVEAAPE